MKNIIVLCILLAPLALAQRQSVVVLPTLADPESKIDPKQLDVLTEDIRTVVTKTLPTKDFNLLKQSEVQEALGDAGYFKSCEEGSCVGDLIKKVQANFGARCDIYTVNKQLYMKFELYGTLKGQSEAGTIDQFNEPVKEVADMQAKIKNEVPAMLIKITKDPRVDCEAAGNTWKDGVCKTYSEMMQGICESGGNTWIGGACKSFAQIDCESKGRVWMNDNCRSSTAAPAQVFEPGVSDLQTSGDYEFSDRKRYLVNITTEPEGAVLSFNGMPDARCIKTPCKTELMEGRIRIIADLEQYEKADTTASIAQNNQNINIKLKANFGVLDIRSAYLEGVGANENWYLSINDKAKSSLKNNLSPGKYKVKLEHECYDPLSFDVGINRDKREVFDMTSHINLKKGGLVLSAEQDGSPVSEPVFINGKRVGETPFSGSVPICSEVKIGKEKVNVRLEYKQTVRHMHKMPDSEERKRRMEEERKQNEIDERIAKEREREMRKVKLGMHLGAGFTITPGGSNSEWFDRIYAKYDEMDDKASTAYNGIFAIGFVSSFWPVDMMALIAGLNYNFFSSDYEYYCKSCDSKDYFIWIKTYNNTISIPVLLQLRKRKSYYFETGYQWGFPFYSKVYTRGGDSFTHGEFQSDRKNFSEYRLRIDQAVILGFGLHDDGYYGVRFIYNWTKLDRFGTLNGPLAILFTLSAF